MPETFEHKPEQWTVGKLREALKHLPDDTPLYVGVADGPGSKEFDDRVLVDYEPVESIWPATSDEPERVEVTHYLFADWQAGTYDRPR
ncbi:DUF6225 family protein [Streptomyces gardneri]|uniref:DUF6225 family protein n=1 Tax=Streptomyces gardneri TaxID=66892 RepID=UPI0035D56ADC